MRCCVLFGFPVFSGCLYVSGVMSESLGMIWSGGSRELFVAGVLMALVFLLGGLGVSVWRFCGFRDELMSDLTIALCG